MSKSARQLNTKEIERIEALASVGCSIADICLDLKTSTRSFYRACDTQPEVKFALIRGRAQCGISIKAELFRQMKSGSTAASIFLAKAILGWHDKPPNLILSDSSDEELTRRAQKIIANLHMEQDERDHLAQLIEQSETESTPDQAPCQIPQSNDTHLEQNQSNTADTPNPNDLK